MERDEVAGRRKVRKTNKTRGSPVAKTTEPHRKIFRHPGFLRFVDRASRAQARSVGFEGARCTQVPPGAPKKAFRTEEPTAGGERAGQTAFSSSAARVLVG